MKKKYTFVPQKYIVTCKRELKNNILEMKRITSKTDILFHPFFRDAGPKACKKYIFILVEDSIYVGGSKTKKYWKCGLINKT